MNYSKYPLDEFDTQGRQEMFNLDNGMLPLNGDNIPSDSSRHDAWDYRYLGHVAQYMDDSETDTRLPEDEFAAQVMTTRHLELMRFFDEVQEHNEDAEWLDYLESDLSVDDDITDEEYYENAKGDEGSFFENIVDGDDFTNEEKVQEDFEMAEVKKVAEQGTAENWEDKSAKEKRPGNRQKPSIIRDKERQVEAGNRQVFWEATDEQREQIAELLGLNIKEMTNAEKLAAMDVLERRAEDRDADLHYELAVDMHLNGEQKLPFLMTAKPNLELRRELKEWEEAA